MIGDRGDIQTGRVSDVVDYEGQAMAVLDLKRWLPSARRQRKEMRPETLTLADIDADTGKGPAANLEEGEFHASTEDFIAALRARQNGSSQ